MIDTKKLETTEFYQHRFKNFSTMIILPTATIFLGLLLFLIFAKREVTILTTAEIEPINAAVSVQATAANRIVSNYMKEGKRVKKGETLLIYHDVANPTQAKLLEQELATLREQQQQLDLFKQSITNNKSLFPKADRFGYQQQLQDYLNQRRVLELESQAVNSTQAVANAKNKEIDQLLQTSIKSSQSKISAISEAKVAIQNGKSLEGSHVYHYLYQQYDLEKKEAESSAQPTVKGKYLAQLDDLLANEQSNLSSLKTQQVSQREADVSEHQVTQNKAKMASLQNQINQSIANELVKVEQTIQTEDAKLMALKDETQNYKIKASANGVLHLETELTGNQYVPSGSVLAKILPDLANQTVANLRLVVSPAEIMSVKRGQNVRLRVAENVPTPMTLDGKIHAIDIAPTRDSKLGNYFNVKARVSLSKQQRNSLYYGLAGQASVVTGTKTYWNYFADKMLGNK
ncbi:bacteriocin ABC transporter permease [Lactobacillus sp. HMSC068F07]|nr:bacteriocin ABC transporter permease [Lactobacillus sp. HMSC068F07]